jgi:GxxExxY protein
MHSAKITRLCQGYRPERSASIFRRSKTLRCKNFCVENCYPQITQITQRRDTTVKIPFVLKNLTEADPRTYAIIGAAKEVHKQLGCGFLEPVYQEALAIEFMNRDIPFVREVKLQLAYKGQPLDSRYCPDFICFDSVVVELKALQRTSGTEEAQDINSLKVTGHQTGLLINFGARSLQHRRFVLTKSA